MSYQRFIDEDRQEAQRLLAKFNRILALSDDGDVQADIDSVQRKCKGELEQLEQLAQALVELQGRFFTELKAIGDRVGIPLPEPDAISLLDLGSINLSGMLGQLAEEWGLSTREYDPALWSPFARDLPLANLALLLRRDATVQAQATNGVK